MIRDLEREFPAEHGMADVCIVGAGAAGITLAVELVRLGKRVLVLEGGGPDVEERSQEPYRSEVVGHEHRGVHTGRFRSQGGTTKRWGGQILPLDPIDFARRDWVEGSGWPIELASLAPHYQRALEIEGVAGSIPQDSDVWRALRIDAPQFAGLDAFFTRWCPDPDFTRVHRATLDGSAVDLWLHANVVRLNMCDERVDSVTARTLDGRETTFRAQEFVFALGAIECSRFFLQPREGGLPWNRSGLLGRHFQDHIDCNAATVKPVDAAAFHRLFDNVFLRGYKYHPKLKLSPEQQAQHRTLHIAATMNFVSDIDETLASIKSTAKNVLRGRLRDISGKDVGDLVRNAPLLAKQVLRYTRDHRMYNPPDASIQLRVHCEQEPLGASSITLAENRDRLGLLRTRLDWQIADSELVSIRRFVTLAQESLAGLATITPHPALLEGDAALRAACDDSNHHMGGMRMQDDPARGVVATDLRLHGTTNCYIASSAVFPTSGFSNPTHTTLALAVRLAVKLASH